MGALYCAAMAILKRPGFWALAVAVLIRLVYVSEIVHIPYFDEESPAFDESNFDTGAKALEHGDWRAPASNEMYSPLYKYLLGTLYWTGGHVTPLRVGLARTAQLGLGVAVAWWVYRLGSLWGSPAAGLLASLLYSAFGQALFYESKLLREFPATAAMMAALWIGRDGLAARRRWLGSAVLFGIACQLRSNLALVGLLFVGRAFLSAPSRRRGLQAAGLWGLVFCLSLLPSMTRNYLVLGDSKGRPHPHLPTAVRTGGLSMFTVEPQAPIVLAVTNHPSQNSIYCMHGAISPEPEIQRYGYPDTPSMGRTLSMVLRWFRKDPCAFLRLQLRKAYWTLWDGEGASNHNFYLWQELAPVLRLPGSHFGALAAFALSALCVGYGRRALPPFAWGCLGAVLLGVCIAYPAGRVRSPCFPLLMIACSLTARAAWGALRARRILPVAVQAVVFSALTALFLPPEPGFLRKALGMAESTPRELLMREIDLSNLAFHYVLRETLPDLETGERWMLRAWNQSIRFGPGRMEATHARCMRMYSHILQRLLQERRTQEAIETALRWERMAPGIYDPHAVMAWAWTSGLPSPEAASAGRRAAYRALLRNPEVMEGWEVLALHAARCGWAWEAADALGRYREVFGPPSEAWSPTLYELHQRLAGSPLPDRAGAPARLEEAKSLVDKGKRLEAVGLLRTMAREGQLEDVAGLLLLADLAPEQDPALQEWALLRALRRDPNSMQAHQRAATLYCRLGVPQRAAFHVFRLGELEPKGPWAARSQELNRLLSTEAVPYHTPRPWLAATLQE